MPKLTDDEDREYDPTKDDALDDVLPVAGEDDEAVQAGAEDVGDPNAGEDRSRAKFEPDFDGEAAKAEREAEEGKRTNDDNRLQREERRARLLGWAPKEEWRGDPNRWVDARTFNDRASPAALFDKIERLASERALEREEYGDNFKRIERQNAKALERQQREFKDRLDSLRVERDRNVIAEAAANGEEAAEALKGRWDAHIQAEEGKRPIDDDPAPLRTAKPGADADKQVADAGRAWIAKRPAYNTDPVFKAAAYNKMSELDQQMADRPVEERFVALDKWLAESGRFADVYGGQTRTNPGAPPAGGRSMDGVRINTRKNTTYASRLPQIAKDQFDRFKKKGVYVESEREDYAKEFFSNAKHD